MNQAPLSKITNTLGYSQEQAVLSLSELKQQRWQKVHFASMITLRPVRTGSKPLLCTYHKLQDFVSNHTCIFLHRKRSQGTSRESLYLFLTIFVLKLRFCWWEFMKSLYLFHLDTTLVGLFNFCTLGIC